MDCVVLLFFVVEFRGVTPVSVKDVVLPPEDTVATLSNDNHSIGTTDNRYTSRHKGP